MVRTVTEPCRAALTATLHGPCDRCNSRNCGCQAGWLQSCKTNVINCSAYTTSRRRAHMWRLHARSCVAPPCIATPSCPPAARNNQIVKGSKLLSCTHRTNVIHQQFMLLLLINASSVNCNYILLSGQSFWQLPMLQPDRCILVSQLNNFMRPKSQHVVQQQQTTPGKATWKGGPSKLCCLRFASDSYLHTSQNKGCTLYEGRRLSMHKQGHVSQASQ